MGKHIFPLLILFLFSLWSLSSLFHPGFMYTHDGLWHIERLTNMVEHVRTQFPLRFSPDLDNGYGIPLFNFTYPVPYYLGSLLMFLGLGPIMAYNTLIFLSYLSGGVGFYFLTKNKFSGLMAALYYLLTPYFFLDIFVRGALGEIVALGIMPWVLLVFARIRSGGRWYWYYPLPFALLILSHNFYAYLFGGLLLIYILALSKHTLLQLSNLILSLSLSAFFIVPAFLEKNLLLYSNLAQTGYQDHFVAWSQFFSRSWHYLGSLPGFDPSEMSYQLGISTLIILALGFLTLFFRRTSSLGWYLGSTLLMLFLMLSPSMFLWELLPLLPSTQFPWRLLGVVAVLIPLIYLELARVLQKTHFNSAFVVGSYLLLGVSIFWVLGIRNPEKWLSEAEFLALHYEYVGKTTTAHRSEIVPVWAANERHAPPNRLVLPSGVEIRDQLESAPSISFTATSQGDNVAVFHRNYYPMWQLKVDGQPIALSPTASGEIEIPLVPGEHFYEINLVSTQVQLLGNAITLASLGIWAWLIYRQLVVKSPSLSSPSRTSKRA